MGGNISYNFGNISKEVVSTSTKTKTMTVNGIKKTEISKTILYGDGTTETVTKLVWVLIVENVIIKHKLIKD